MANKSSIAKQPKEIREAIDAAIREGRATYDEIVLMVRTMGGDVKRSAVGRYAKNAAQQFKEFREAQEIAKVWADKLTEEPNGDVGMLVGQMLRTVSMQTVAAMNQGDGDDAQAAKPMDIMLIAKALDHISKSENQQLARTLKVREQTLLDAAKTARGTAAKAGLSEDVIRQIERDVLGLR